MLALTSFQIYLFFVLFTLLFLAVAARIMYVIVRQVLKGEKETFEKRDN